MVWLVMLAAFFVAAAAAIGYDAVCIRELEERDHRASTRKQRTPAKPRRGSYGRLAKKCREQYACPPGKKDVLVVLPSVTMTYAVSGIMFVVLGGASVVVLYEYTGLSEPAIVLATTAISIGMARLSMFIMETTIVEAAGVHFGEAVDAYGKGRVGFAQKHSVLEVPGLLRWAFRAEMTQQIRNDGRVSGDVAAILAIARGSKMLAGGVSQLASIAFSTLRSSAKKVLESAKHFSEVETQ